uniref:Phospholipase B1, membrane-associated n=1 Tax=Pristionchus pacificus TaxID=54126 RepID=A0A8R1USB4_PRIPA
MRRVIVLCSLLSVGLGVVRDLGMPGWSCDAGLMKKSKSVPQSVHALRPADIGIVGAIGDSLTAGNGAGAEPGDILGVAIQYRGLTFSVGGDKSLDEHITMANVLRKFNPDLFGYSVKTGSSNVWETAALNGAIPGAHSWDLLEQAHDLVRRLKEHPDTKYEEKWKLIHIFIGGNDMCAWCVHQKKESADAYRDNIRAAIQVFKDELPKTMVVLTGMVDISLLRIEDADQELCKKIHVLECECEMNPNVTDEMLGDETKLYQQKEQELQDSGEFDTTDDFTLIIQPFFEGVKDVGRNVTFSSYTLFTKLTRMSSKLCSQPDGTPNMDFFAPDCFHFAAYGHAITARALWNNMMQPVGSKTTANFTDNGEPLLCPEPTCPFIRTTKNSVDCTKHSIYVACRMLSEAPLMLELMGPNGGKRTLRAKKGGFLTEIVTPGGYRTMSIVRSTMDGQHFTVEQINDYEVALRSRDGYYMSHQHLDFAGSVSVVKEPEILTPVRNSDGSWSFKSRWNKWMSSKRTAFSPDALFESENTDHEQWWLEPCRAAIAVPFVIFPIWINAQPLVVLTTAQSLSTAPNRTLLYPHPLRSKREANTPLMLELLGPDGGERTLKAHNGKYLTETLTNPEGNQLIRTEFMDPWTRANGQNLGFADVASVAREWEMLTPVKNDDDGSWSFKTRWNKWLSDEWHAIGPAVSFTSDKSIRGHWWLESW